LARCIVARNAKTFETEELTTKDTKGVRQSSDGIFVEEYLEFKLDLVDREFSSTAGAAVPPNAGESEFDCD
jgi:hypothetical protein